MLDILVGKTFAIRTLSQSHAFAKRLVIRLAVGGVEVRDRVGAVDADGHGGGT